MCSALFNNLALSAALHNFLSSLSHVTYPSLLLLVGNGLLGTLASTSVGLGALTVHGQAATMTQAAVAADLRQTLDVHSGSAAQVTLDQILLLDNLTQLSLLVIGQILDANVGIDAGLSQDLLGAGSADAVNISQTNFNTLFAGQVYTSNTCYNSSAPPISLVSACVWGFRKLP